jgi:hypothetical protein
MSEEQNTTSSSASHTRPQPVLGFTGSRFTPDARTVDRIYGHLDRLGEHAPGFVTGACRGLDTIIGEYCAEKFPDRHQLVIVPANTTQVDRWWLPFGSAVTVIHMPPGTTYKDRNQSIVDNSGRLVGFPIGAEDDPRQRRSGTWQTIRMGRRAHRLGPLILRLDAL